MIECLIQLVVVALVLVVLGWLVRTVAGPMGLPAVVWQIVGVLLVLIFLLYILQHRACLVGRV